MTSSSTFDLQSWQAGHRLVSFSQTCFAEYWDILPELDDTKIDPYNFEHRMALGKRLIAATTAHGQVEDHWHWGYLAQLDWQWRSGRLSNSLCSIEIAKDSWFGYMNLNFTVAVYQGAAQAGLVRKISLNHDDPGFQACVKIWYSFWIKYKILASQSPSNLYRALWSTHTDIIKTSLPYAKKFEKNMPPLELQFGLGWCHMVEILAAMGWTLLSLHSLLEHGAGYLPSKVLTSENIKWLKDHRHEEYVTTMQMIELNSTSPKKMEQICTFFRRLTRWEGERRAMPISLKKLTHGSNRFTKLWIVSRMLIKVIIPNSVLEIAIWNCVILGVYAALHNKITH